MGVKNKSTESGSTASVVAAPSAVVVSSTKKRLSKRVLLLIMAAIVIAAIAVAFVLMKDKGQGSNTATTEGNKKYQAVLQEADRLGVDGNETQKARNLETYLATDPPKEQQVVPTQQLASAYLNSGEYQKAINTFGKLAELDPHFAISAYQGQAGAYVKLGNKQAAIDAHNKIIDIYKGLGEDRYNARIIMERQEIARLQGKDQ